MRAIDGWINVRMPGPPAPWQIAVAQQLFKRPAEEIFRPYSIPEILELMDRAGVERAIVTVTVNGPDPEVLAFADKHPDRFAISAVIDPRRGMKALRELESLKAQHPVRVARVIPCLLGLPPDDRAYYPLYAKCVELDLAVSINTGIPGPPLPGKCQDPIHLDEVCLFFPELRVVMANGADPWWAMAIRLMQKYNNLTLMTSAFAPKYLPAELIQFMNTRGQDKVIFGTDFPFLTMERCVKEAQGLDLREGVLDKYLRTNAERVFGWAS
jgi:predicted TIM-barrel fold metal-dependent hydrolase